VTQLPWFQQIYPNLVMHFCVFLDSERSHLSSFTMKLKGKFHSPKIKRTPSKKGKPADLTVKTPEKSANKVSRRRTCSVSLDGFLLAGTQFIKICSPVFRLCPLQNCADFSRILGVTLWLVINGSVQYKIIATKACTSLWRA